MITENRKSKLDTTSLALFLPSIIALAITPTIIRITMVETDNNLVWQIYKGFKGIESGIILNMDTYSQGKAAFIAVFSVIMLVLALLGCKYFFRGIEKRSLFYAGASAAYVAMTLASAIGSEHSDIAINGIFNRAEGFFTLACYFVMFLYTMYAFKKTQNFTFIVLALMVCTAVNLILGLFQYFGTDLLNYEWFKNLVIEGKYRELIEMTTEAYPEKIRLHGALNHYNYMGSFTGMIIPMFTVLAFSCRKVFHKIILVFFALASIFMMIASEARSGFVAMAVAAVVGIFVFARVLIRRWKITVSVAAAAVIAVVGLNVATDNAVFARIPSLFEDMVSLVAPAEKTDIFAELPVREITHNKDGSVSFTSQTDVLTLTFDSESKEFIFTDSNGTKLPVEESPNGTVIPDEDFPGISFGFSTSDNEPGYNDTVSMWFYNRSDSILSFRLFGEKTLHMVDYQTGQRVYPINAEAIGFEGKEKLGSSRGYIWSRTIPLLDECIITGYGPDTYAFVFPQNDYLAKYYSYGEGFNIVVDKPHNLYLQIFMSSGLIALIAFLGICVFYLVDCLRLYALKKKYRMEQYFGISVMLAVVGYLAAGMFNDSTVSVAPVFWILLGTGAALNTINRRMDKQEKAEAEAALQAEQPAASDAKTEEKAEEAEKNPPPEAVKPMETDFYVTMEVTVREDPPENRD